jgi:hypothetical protein
MFGLEKRNAELLEKLLDKCHLNLTGSLLNKKP